MSTDPSNESSVGDGFDEDGEDGDPPACGVDPDHRRVSDGQGGCRVCTRRERIWALKHVGAAAIGIALILAAYEVRMHRCASAPGSAACQGITQPEGGR
ncbi:MAG: hypothetical protein ACHREM_04600 [Polyangiales bacterium]